MGSRSEDSYGIHHGSDVFLESYYASIARQTTELALSVGMLDVLSAMFLCTTYQKEDILSIE